MGLVLVHALGERAGGLSINKDAAPQCARGHAEGNAWVGSTAIGVVMCAAGALDCGASLSFRQHYVRG